MIDPGTISVGDGEQIYLVQHAVGGTLSRIGTNTVNPMKNYHHNTEGMEGTRKAVKSTISRASRCRLLRLCASFDQASIDGNQVLFCTLTYGSDEKALSYEWKDYKRHLNHFNTTIRREFENRLFGIWRIEWQKRGVAHFHFAFMFVDGFRAFIDKNWLSQTWNNIVQGSNNHLKAGTNVERAKSWKNTSHYFSKTMAYIGKDGPVSDELRDKPLGRHWGYVNKTIMRQYLKRKTAKVSYTTYFKLRRVFLGYIKRRKETITQRQNKHKYDHSWWKAFKSRICDYDLTMTMFMEAQTMEQLTELFSSEEDIQWQN